MLESFLDITRNIAFKMMQFYPGNKTGGIPGLFGDPYYWWESGAVFGVGRRDQPDRLQIADV